ncbi:MAG: cell division protein ZapE [Alphaproteobacteria bacterium]|nr:cell division protein ZapE [Alphaproteobacteria bacterium]
MSANLPLSDWARKGFEDRNLTPDMAQKEALNALGLLRDKIIVSKSRKWSFFSKSGHADSPYKGAYIFGPVGRGKTVLMDIFCEEISKSESVRRIHFHEFMIEVHDFLHEYRKGEKGKGADKALDAYAVQLSKTYKLLCFDEFHVTNVADAMILSRLFTSLFNNGLFIIMTSNWMPDRLYEGGLQRVRFLPFIELIKRVMISIPLEGGKDYRRTGLHERQVFFQENEADKMNDLFSDLTGGASKQPEKIKLRGRMLHVGAASKNVAEFTFNELCEKPLGAEDYLKLAERFDVIFLKNIPVLDETMRNESKRLMSLIDVLYDKKKMLVMSSEKAITEIFKGNTHKFEFERTLSRIQEMGSTLYLKDFENVG